MYFRKNGSICFVAIFFFKLFVVTELEPGADAQFKLSNGNDNASAVHATEE